jgi:hypothetical protein
MLPNADEAVLLDDVWPMRLLMFHLAHQEGSGTIRKAVESFRSSLISMVVPNVYIRAQPLDFHYIESGFLAVARSG